MLIQERTDGEYKRESLVTVELDAFQASLFAPEKLKLIQDTTAGILMQNRSDVVQERYVVQVRRIDRTWEYLVAIGSEEFKIPGKVFDRLMAYRKSIIEEQRREGPGGRPATAGRRGGPGGGRARTGGSGSGAGVPGARRSGLRGNGR